MTALLMQFGSILVQNKTLDIKQIHLIMKKLKTITSLVLLLFQIVNILLQITALRKSNSTNPFSNLMMPVKVMVSQP